MGEISGRDVNHNVFLNEKAATSVNNLPSTAESQLSPNPHPHPKTYFCHLCRKSFTSKANKAKHYKSVHLMERKECGICKKNFSNVYNLKRHIHGAHGAVFDQKTGMIYDQRTNRSQSLSPIPLEGNPLVATNGDGIFPGRNGAKVTFREWDSSPPKLHHEDSTSSSSSDSKLLISIPAAPLGPPDQSFFEAFIPPRYHHIQDISFKDWITDDDNLNFLSNDNGILQDPDFLRGIGRETHDLKPEESSTSQFPAASFNLQPRLQKAPTPTICCTKELIPQLQHIPSPSRFTSAPSSHYVPLPERQRGPASRPPKVTTSRSQHRSPFDEGEKFAFMNRLGLVRSKAKVLGNGINDNDNTIDRNILLPLTKEEIASFHRRQDQRIFEKVKTYCHQAAFKESAEGKAERAKLRKKGRFLSKFI